MSQRPDLEAITRKIQLHGPRHPTGVLLPSDLENYRAESDMRVIEPLSPVNLIVGPNNGGKSKLLRHLFAKMGSKADVCIGPHSEYALELTRGALDVLELVRARGELMSRARGVEVFGAGAFTAAQAAIENINSMPLWTAEDISGVIAALTTCESHLQRAVAAYHRVDGGVLSQVREVRDVISGLLGVLYPSPLVCRFVYMPVFRTLRPLRFAAPGLLANVVAGDYFAGKTLETPKENKTLSVVDRTVFTGEELHVRLTRLRLGNRVERERVDHFEAFLGREFFDGREVELVPSAADDSGTVYVRIGREKERPIYELGDGLQQVIILAWPLFEYESDDLILFIEEPELFLHPGLQTRLLSALIRHAEERSKLLQVFATTHSNHLLDTTLHLRGVAAFRVEKSLPPGDELDVTPEFTVRAVSAGDRSILEQLGVRNSSVMLSNCTIWVEGITDRLYLRRFLELARKDDDRNFMEDLHYSIVEYGGGNITHWSFANDDPEAIDVGRLCGRVLLICDKDDAPWKDERADAIRGRLGDDHFIRLQSREIENLLAPPIIREVVRQHEEKAGAEDVDFAPFDHADYREKPLGRYIEDVLLRGEKRRKGRYADRSGTLAGKVEFAKRAIRLMQSEADLTEEARELARRVYDFIAGHNPEH